MPLTQIPQINSKAAPLRWAFAFLGMLALSLALAGCSNGGSGGTAGSSNTAASITIQSAPQSVAIDDGDSAVLMVAASSAEPLSYQWQRNGAPIAGAASTVYVTPVLSVADSGVQYSVVVSNGASTVNSGPATVTVRPVAPSIADQPQTQTVELGQKATFTVLARGSQPLSYQWQRDGVDIPNATSASFTVAEAVALDAGRRFRVIVRNAAGEVASDDAMLQVNGAGPVILGIIEFAVASPGQRLVITATFAGNPPFMYQWLRNDQPISGAAGSTDSASVSITTLPLTGADDGVRFALTVTNADGTTRSPDALISVISSPRVAAGGAHSLARSANGATVWAWGDNRYGQLGLGSTTSTAIPAVIGGLTGVRALAAGADHSLALKDDGTVWAWGRNVAGAIGDGTQTDRLAPQLVGGLTDVIAIAAGDGRSFALRADGSLWGWGENSTGALGIGSQNNAPTPTQVGQFVGGFAGIVAVAAGARHTLALRSDGRVFVAGEVAVPQLNGPSVLASPAALDGLALITSVAAGNGFSVSLDINGKLWSWGVNGSGQLGLGNTTPRALPLSIDRSQAGTGLLPALRLAAGNDFAAARSLDGSALSWGADASGQLGDGAASTGATAPTRVASLFGPVLDIATGHAHALAVRADGTVYSWGANAAGQLGIGSSEAQRAEPVQIPGLNLN
jgi:alpha-tubulin suppressor-like RCC1 family protein